MKIYKYKIKDGAFNRNQALFRYSENTANIIDGAICRIIDVIQPNNNFFKDTIPQKKITTFYEIEIYHSNSTKNAYIIEEDIIELKPQDFLHIK